MIRDILNYIKAKSIKAAWAATDMMYVAALHEVSLEQTKVLVQHQKNLNRPCVVMKVGVERTESGWVAFYDDLECFGETPEMACQAFDDAWIGREQR